MAVQYSETHINRAPLQDAAGKRLVKFGKGLMVQMLRDFKDSEKPPEVDFAKWQELEDEFRREIAVVLVLLFMQSWDGWDVDSGDAESEAMIFANLRASWLANRFMETTKTRYDRLRAQVSEADDVIGQAIADGWNPSLRGGYPRREDLFPGMADTWSPTVPDARARDAMNARQKALDGIEELFNPSRMESVARTEATRAISAATMAAAKRKGVNVEVYWRLGPNENHCPFCTRMHNKPKSFWSRFSNGPPAHPNCQCALDVVAGSASPMMFYGEYDGDIVDSMEMSGALESAFWLPDRFCVEQVPRRSLKGLWGTA